ncbi:MAG: hypothetical protein IKO64_05580 [Kiritimatiellae bacterium]|nr:hypothetical protein [Kiritimatiellia bacterium]
MKLNKQDAKFVKDALGKRLGFQMGARPVGAVDNEKLILHDVAVCIQGEALGHGIWLDEDFIHAVVAQGNASDKGLLCHFGHEEPNGNRIVNYMGSFSNFVEKPATAHDGSAVIGAFADVKFSRAMDKHGDNVALVMDLAKERPDALGLSIVFDIADYFVKTAAGDKLKWQEYWADKQPQTWEEYYRLSEAFFEQSADGRLYVEMGKLYGADFVAEGAATDGLFKVGEKTDAFEALTAPFKALEGLAEENEETVENLKKRLAGFQSMHDKKMAELKNELAAVKSAAQTATEEFQGQIGQLGKDLEAANAALSAKIRELESAKRELGDLAERLERAENAHRKLTGGALTIGEPKRYRSLSEFYADHGNSLHRAKLEDPATYARLCREAGMA